MIETIDISALANPITDEQFQQLCAQNRDTKFEMSSQGELIVMSPTGSESGRQNADLLIQIGTWNRQHKLGVVFDSSTGFTLLNGAKRSPDVSWIENSRWNSLTQKQKRGFAPITPDFLLELMFNVQCSMFNIQCSMSRLYRKYCASNRRFLARYNALKLVFFLLHLVVGDRFYSELI